MQKSNAAGNTIEKVENTVEKVDNTAQRTNDAVEKADEWELARNPIYRGLQHRLIERTVERDLLRCACQLVIARVCMPDLCC
jgi:hypothetical protein